MSGWPEGTERIILETVDSTMLEAARQTASPPFWVLSYDQTAGRGRRGRAWGMPMGNFAASLVLEPEGPVNDWALRSFTMSLALREAFDALTGRGDLFTLKWPNDVLCQGRKIAGILLESDQRRLTIGVGVNLVAHPEQAVLDEHALEPTNLLEATGQRIAPEPLLDALADAHGRWETLLAEAGFGPVRTAWLAHAANIGREVTARMPGRVITGHFRKVDAAGACVLDTPTGPHVLAAADLHFARS